MHDILDQLERRRDQARQGGGERRVAAQGQADGALAQREAEYKTRFANPFVAAQLGYIDDVIMPHGTRRRIIRALKSLKGKALANPDKKHDNIPL